MVPLPARVSLLSGIYVTTEIPDLQAIAVQRCLYHSLARILEAPLELIFMLRGAPKAHEVCLEGTQYKTLSAAAGVAYEEARHLSRP